MSQEKQKTLLDGADFVRDVLDIYRKEERFQWLQPLLSMTLPSSWRIGMLLVWREATTSTTTPYFRLLP